MPIIQSFQIFASLAAASGAPSAASAAGVSSLLPTLHIVHIAASALMLGVVLAAQAVMYPGFAWKDPSRFREAMHHHQRSISFIVAPGMLVEGACAMLLLATGLLSTPAGLTVLAVANAALLLSCWLLTFALIVPMHMRLTTNDQFPGERTALIARLVRLHWWRTAAWSLHALLACIMASSFLRSAA